MHDIGKNIVGVVLGCNNFNMIDIGVMCPWEKILDAAEELSYEDMLKVKYDGIRPAPGYPSQPDHTEKLTMWEMLDAEAATGIELTDTLAMLPAASVSGLYFGGKCSEYFAVGKITDEQVKDYAGRKQMDLKVCERWLQTMLNYKP